MQLEIFQEGWRSKEEQASCGAAPARELVALDDVSGTRPTITRTNVSPRRSADIGGSKLMKIKSSLAGSSRATRLHSELGFTPDDTCQESGGQEMSPRQHPFATPSEHAAHLRGPHPASPKQLCAGCLTVAYLGARVAYLSPTTKTISSREVELHTAKFGCSSNWTLVASYC